MMVIIPFGAKEEERKTMMWVYFFAQCFSFNWKSLTLQAWSPDYFELSKETFKLQCMNFLIEQCIQLKAFLLFIQDSRDYDGQDRSKSLAVTTLVAPKACNQ